MNQHSEDIEKTREISEKMRSDARLLFRAAGFLISAVALGIFVEWVSAGSSPSQQSIIVMAVAIVIALLAVLVGGYLRLQAQRISNTNEHNINLVPKKITTADTFTLDELSHSKPWNSNKKVVLVTGYFDTLHAGHVEFLAECKEKESDEEILVVGVNSDDLARRIKGKNRPIINAQDRIVAVKRLRNIDFVFEATDFYDAPPYRILRAIDPDYIVFSYEPGPYQRKTELVNFVEDFAKDNNFKPQIRFIPIQRPDIHTTSIEKKIIHGERIVLQQDFPRWLRFMDYKLRDIAAEKGVKGSETSAILVQDGEFVGEGYNFRPEYFSDDEVIHVREDTEEFRNDAPRPVHAEITAIINALNSGKSVDFSKCEVYTLTAPCSACAETLAKLKVAKVYYSEEFVNNYGILVLKNHGIPCEKVRF